MLTYKKMSLFDAPEGSILVHACNSQGKWGRGIAKTFRDLYPESYGEYARFCERFLKSPEGSAVGHALITSGENDRGVGCIITSHHYSPELKDSVEVIKINTALALNNLMDQIQVYIDDDNFDGGVVYSNKFNSGLFGVPWEDSELILKTLLKRYPQIKWVVCDPEGN